ncbi:MAG: SHOCT domain-containing protein [Bacteroidales bacterium]
MKYCTLLTILVVAFFFSSCATILTGTTQRVTIDSTPRGADIIVDGRMMGTTPARVRLNRDINAFMDDGKEIELLLQGYYPEGYFLGTDIEPSVILNMCPFGFALDAVTGAIMKYDSDYYNFRMVPLDQAPVSSTVPPPINQVSEEDDYERLMKLVDLYEEGLITEEEFEAEKAKIFENKRQ